MMPGEGVTLDVPFADKKEPRTQSNVSHAPQLMTCRRSSDHLGSNETMYHAQGGHPRMLMAIRPGSQQAAHG